MTKRSQNSYSIYPLLEILNLYEHQLLFIQAFISVGLKSYLQQDEKTYFQCGEELDSSRDHNKTINMVGESFN